MVAARYKLRTGTEGGKQLYWGAFWLGAAAFCEHKKRRFCLDSMASEELALRRFRRFLLDSIAGEEALVDDRDLGEARFVEGFTSGYRCQRLRSEAEGLEVCRDLESDY